MRLIPCAFALISGLTTAACGQAVAAREPRPPPPAFDRSFWDQWGDGQAELSGYALTTPRYGELRTGSAVTIFVTETFSKRDRVKADPGKHPKDDELPVLKLNYVKSFQTGVYDYDLMTSTFLALAPAFGRDPGSPVKVSFSAQEWCGHVYHQLLFDDGGKARETSHSYFDGEADQARTTDAPNDGLVEDAALAWARGLAAPTLQPGGATTVPFLISATRARLLHRPLAWSKAELSRSATTRQATVPAGTFEVDEWRIEAGPLTLSYLVEKAAPHRVVQWTGSDGERAELLGSTRSKYWEQHGEGFERELAKLRLKPPAQR